MEECGAGIWRSREERQWWELVFSVQLEERKAVRLGCAYGTETSGALMCCATQRGGTREAERGGEVTARWHGDVQSAETMAMAHSIALRRSKWRATTGRRQRPVFQAGRAGTARRSMVCRRRRDATVETER